jgi:hypothetical protein
MKSGVCAHPDRTARYPSSQYYRTLTNIIER